MRNMAEQVQEILDRTASTAVPLTVLVATLEREFVMIPGGPAGLLTELRGRPDLFRVLDPCVGPWRRPVGGAGVPSRGSLALDRVRSLAHRYGLDSPRPYAVWDGSWIRDRRWPPPDGLSSWCVRQCFFRPPRYGCRPGHLPGLHSNQPLLHSPSASRSTSENP